MFTEESDMIEVWTKLDSIWTSKKGAFKRAGEILKADSKRRWENRRTPVVTSLHLNRPEETDDWFEFFYDGSIRNSEGEDV